MIVWGANLSSAFRGGGGGAGEGRGHSLYLHEAEEAVPAAVKNFSILY